MTIFSYNIALSDPEDYENGGTYFPSLNAVHGSARELTFKPGRGAGIAHPSKFKHGGTAITHGTRYLLVGFLKLRTPVSRVHKMLEMLVSCLVVELGVERRSREVVARMQSFKTTMSIHPCLYLIERLPCARYFAERENQCGVLRAFEWAERISSKHWSVERRRRIRTT